MDRWRRRNKVIVEESVDTIFDDGNGPQRKDVVVHYSPEDTARILAGYLCLRCQEPQERAFPAVCSFPHCEYPIADRQLYDFAKEFKGNVHLGAAADTDEEIERMREDRARTKHVPGSTIVVPSGARV